jgi:zinc transport system ATP-binding protein
MEFHTNGSSSTDACTLCCTKIEDFSVTIGKTEILKDVSLHIHCGELTAIIGPNGAGKSTLLKAIMGQVKHKGELKYIDARGNKKSEPLIGYVPQHLDFDNGTPVSVLDMFAACRTSIPVWFSHTKRMRSKVSESLKRVQADHLIDKKLGNLSGGELQRVLLALALDPVPELLLLDEPVSGVDQRGMELFYSMVSEIRKNYDISIILISHDLDLVAKYADRVVLLNKTVVSSGSPAEVFKGKKVCETLGTLWIKEKYDE